MRTTIRPEPAVEAAAKDLAVSQQISLSAAVNRLAEAGMARRAMPKPKFVQRTAKSGLLIDVTHVGDALDFLEGPHHQ
jgi:hypothetical protein